MTVDELLTRCDLVLASEKKLSECKPFSCGEGDLDEFFAKDCLVNQRRLLGKTYLFCLKDQPDTIDLWAYYNQADEVELFINGKSPGVKKKTSPARGILPDGENKPSTLCTEFHVGWRVSFHPGEIRAVSRKNGHTVAEQTIRTAGAPHHLRLTVDYAGRDLTFIQAEVLDKDGNLCPWAEDEILFTATAGPAQVIATDNGCQTSMQRFTSPRRRAFFGRSLAVVRGRGTITAQSYSLAPASLTIP